LIKAGGPNQVMSISLARTEGFPLQVLCLGCHSDDIEIGCGGTILRLAQQYPGTMFHWVVFSAIGVREDEARRGALKFTEYGKLVGPLLKKFRDGYMPFSGSDLKNVFEELKSQVRPDLVLTHYRDDAHQDHRLVSRLTWNTFRDHVILEYEIPKYDGDLSQPNFYVPLPDSIYDKKVRYLMDVFESQRSKRWFQESTFLGLMRLRGVECNAQSGYAEAFHCRKVVL
jgi:LmbE family N-acetylglucosaminyl deacetylase